MPNNLQLKRPKLGICTKVKLLTGHFKETLP